MVPGWMLGAVGVGGVAAGGLVARKKGLHRWLIPYLLSSRKRQRPQPGRPVHVLLCICDHYEPKRGGVAADRAKARVQQWVDRYPKLFDRFRDSDGRAPRHTFFYPAEEYEPEYLDLLAGLCHAGYGEVEVHLHHDNDTADNLHHTLSSFKRTLAERHGLLSRDKATGEVVYGFIHGNWALDNARCDGKWCGLNNELDVLRQTGCYADFTLPSAPSETQTRKINSIYWAVDDPARPKSHDCGVDLGVGPPPPNGLLMIQGPLALDWGRRKWGVLPGIENANLQRSQLPDARRLGLWLRTSVQVAMRPDWYFVKLHTHGVNEPNQDVLLGEPMVRFHEHLRERAEQDANFRFHYVTAREMANLALAAASGSGASVRDARDWRYVSVSEKAIRQTETNTHQRLI